MNEYPIATCFGHISWPSSGSYKFDRRVERKASIYDRNM